MNGLGAHEWHGGHSPVHDRVAELERQLEEQKGIITMTNYQRTASWLAACGKEPNGENLSVQIGCDLEEIAEYLETLAFDDKDANDVLGMMAEDLRDIGIHLKRRDMVAEIIDREAALDALCDREVTANGVAFLAGFNKDAADAAVLASNDAKLVDGKPVILPGGKIGKPEGWKAPDLSKFV